MTSLTSFWGISVIPSPKSLAVLPVFHPESLHCYLSHDCLHSLSFLCFPCLHFSSKFPQPCPTILPVLKSDSPSFPLQREGWQSVVKCKSSSTLDTTWPSITSSHCACMLQPIHSPYFFAILSFMFLNVEIAFHLDQYSACGDGTCLMCFLGCIVWGWGLLRHFLDKP